jgi:putative secretion ATPase (PEP-CTERM system associated)
MYEKYFGFVEKPFALRPDSRFLYLGEHHKKALLLMEYGLANEASFLLITGEVGAGKTTLIRCMLDRIDESLVVGLVSNTSRESGRILQWIGLAFGLEVQGKDDVTVYDLLTHFLIRTYAQGKRALLIVDEAQNLGYTRLEEMRLLSNLNADHDFLLQMILVGQPELRVMMKSPRLRQLAQRIGADYHIGRFGEQETMSYVQHRLKVAGGSPDVFTEDAILLVHVSSHGIPRLINQLCDTALVYAYAEQRRHVDMNLMREVIRDRCAGGIFPGKLVGSESPPEPKRAPTSLKVRSVQ